MGQTFRLAAPRAKRSLRWGGKLGEILFDGSAKELVRLLARPIRPQNSLPALEQPLVKQDSQVDCGVAQLPASSSFEDKITSVRSVKQKPYLDEVPTDHLQHHHKRAKASGDALGHVQIHRSIRFSDLPQELHRLVFDHIEFIEDVVCLSLTSRYFWGVGREHIHDYYMSFVGLWAGENIVCVGEDVDPGDFPPGLFSAEEVDELSQKQLKIVYDDGEDSEEEEPFTLYHFTHPAVVAMEDDGDTRGNLWYESGRIHLDCMNRCGAGICSDPAFSLLRPEIVVEQSTYLPQDQAWILRNLTTKEFVRSEAIALKPELIDGPSIGVLGFGEVLMARICWSTSSWFSSEDGSGISRGVWAGHAFDITTVGRHESETKGVGWKDVSEEVAKEMAGIWEDAHGPQWREEVCEPQHG